MPVRNTTKPLDVGSGAVCASFAPDTAGWLSIGAPHQRRGFVELAAVPAFDERDRGDPAATRRHRARLADSRYAFLAVSGPDLPRQLVVDASDPHRPCWRAAGVTAEAWTGRDSTTIVQRWESVSRLRVTLRGALDRPALAEITELDPPRPTGAVTTLRSDGATATLEADALPARVVVELSRGTWRIEDGQATAEVDAGSVELRVTLGAVGNELPTDAPSDPDPDPIVARALAYVRGCTALRTAGDERTILTDHRLLPLSWTRDAYFQALLLLAADGPGDRERVADHLRWLWRRCDRPDGRWVRSHHADGRRKDLAFQADQQLYPIVELADYWRIAGELPDGVDWRAELPRAWRAALEEIDPATGLMASTENAADDPAGAPFIGASQILLWYTAHRVAELAGHLGDDPQRYVRVGDAARIAFTRQFAAAAEPWPYAVDGAGLRIAYHDANDLPLALAPLWGFCDADDPGWRATMAFAFSSANPAWFDGARPGLGSAHTPAPWTLGDVQTWIGATVMGDAGSAEAAIQRLGEVAFADGMLPEAYGADDEARIRHWFAWPGAAYGALRLLARRGRLDALRVG